jgi:hypothetical protein
LPSKSLFLGKAGFFGICRFFPKSEPEQSFFLLVRKIAFVARILVLNVRVFGFNLDLRDRHTKNNIGFTILKKLQKRPFWRKPGCGVLEKGQPEAANQKSFAGVRIFTP